MNIWNVLTRSFDAQRRRGHEETVLFILTLMIGAIVGLMVVAFIVLTENLGSRMYPAGGAAWRRFSIPVLGSLITGFLLRQYFPNARGSGIPQTKTALFLRGGIIKFRTVVGKFICSSVALASGIALGREGPSVQVGAGIASSLGTRLGLSPSRVKALVPIGASAALAAAFNTPIAAVLFTLEEVMGDLHAPVLGAIVLSSATSWMVLHLLLGDEPLFHVPAYQLVHPVEFLIYAGLGLAGGLVSVTFVKLLLWIRKHFLRLPPWTQWIQPAAGGLVVGALGWFVPEVLGVGYNHVSQALNGQLALGTMALLVGLKVVATASCYSSGNAGGIFGPSLFIGAMMGGAFGGAAHLVLPDYTGSVGAYALVGMGTAFAGIVRVPLTSVIMIFEVTRDYSIIVPLMIANLISYFISSRLQEEPVYEALLHQDGIHLPPGPRAREELVLIGQAMRPAEVVLPAESSIDEALAALPADSSAAPVADARGLLGMATRSQLDEAAAQGRGGRVLSEAIRLPAARLTAENFPHVHPDSPLDIAVRRMAQSGFDVLPVVSRSNLRQLLGVISMRDALAAYRLERPEEPPYQESRTPVAVLVVLAGMIAIGGFLSYFYREERIARGQAYYSAGAQLMAKERYAEAVEQYRSALSISHSSRDRFALALALEKADRPAEAQLYFRELLRAEPASGPANLEMARILTGQQQLGEAVPYYRESIRGAWPHGGEQGRAQARVALAETWHKLGRTREAEEQLMEAASEASGGTAIRVRAAHLLLEYGFAKDAAGVFREITLRDASNADAFAGLGEAELALNDYRAAREAFDAGLRARPGDPRISKRLDFAEAVLALDPNLPGLSAAARAQRSVKLLRAALGSFDQCAAIAKGTSPPSAAETSDRARRLLLRHDGHSADERTRLATELWTARAQVCGPPGSADEPLARVMAQAMQ